MDIALLKIACDKNHDTPAFKDGKLMEIKTRDRTTSDRVAVGALGTLIYD